MVTVKFMQTTRTGERTLTRIYEIQVGGHPFAWAGDATHPADVLYAPGGVEEAVNVMNDFVESMQTTLECCELRRAGQLNENPNTKVPIVN